MDLPLLSYLHFVIGFTCYLRLEKERDCLLKFSLVEYGKISQCLMLLFVILRGDPFPTNLLVFALLDVNSNLKCPDMHLAYVNNVIFLLES